MRVEQRQCTGVVAVAEPSHDIGLERLEGRRCGLVWQAEISKLGGRCGTRGVATPEPQRHCGPSLGGYAEVAERWDPSAAQSPEWCRLPEIGSRGPCVGPARSDSRDVVHVDQEGVNLVAIAVVVGHHGRLSQRDPALRSGTQ